MKKLVSGLERFNSRTSIIWALMVIPLMLCTVVDVVARYFFDHSQTWAYDLSLYLLIAIGMLSGAYGLLMGSHVKIDILHQRFPPKMRIIVDIITSLMALGFCVVLLWQGWELAYSALEKGLRGELGTSRWPIFPLRVMVPIGALLISLQFICNIYHHINSLKDSEKSEV